MRIHYCEQCGTKIKAGAGFRLVDQVFCGKCKPEAAHPDSQVSDYVKPSAASRKVAPPTFRPSSSSRLPIKSPSSSLRAVSRHRLKEPASQMKMIAIGGGCTLLLVVCLGLWIGFSETPKDPDWIPLVADRRAPAAEKAATPSIEDTPASKRTPRDPEMLRTFSSATHGIDQALDQDDLTLARVLVQELARKLRGHPQRHSWKQELGALRARIERFRDIPPAKQPRQPAPITSTQPTTPEPKPASSPGKWFVPGVASKQGPGLWEISDGGFKGTYVEGDSYSVILLGDSGWRGYELQFELRLDQGDFGFFCFSMGGQFRQICSKLGIKPGSKTWHKLTLVAKGSSAIVKLSSAVGDRETAAAGVNYRGGQFGFILHRDGIIQVRKMRIRLID